MHTFTASHCFFILTLSLTLFSLSYFTFHLFLLIFLFSFFLRGNSDFKQYVDDLDIMANKEMNEKEMEDITALYDEIMKIEIQFWDMAYECA